MNDFYDFMSIDATQWGIEIDPLGIMTYQNYKRKRRFDESLDFIRSIDQISSMKYDHINNHLILTKRHYEKWPITIKMTLDDYKSMTSSENSSRWINQKIKKNKLKDTNVKDTYILSEEQIDEVLTLQQRMKRKILMRRLAPRIARARKIAMRKRAGTDVLKRRAMGLARRTMASKILGGRSKADVSPSEKARVEKLLAKRKKGIERLAQKLVPLVRKKQATRFKNKAAKANAAHKPPAKPVAKPEVKHTSNISNTQTKNNE